tara:strand:+ start:1454 stop:2494 length:1041 start_codon:yes stop_codon:yes gene_type:complete
MIAIITGVTGQDGSYLAELLLEKGYEVRCAVRRTSHQLSKTHLGPLMDKVKIYECDLTDQSSLFQLFEGLTGDTSFEVYNLGALSQVGTSFECPRTTFEINTLGTLNILEVIRLKDLIKVCKFYQASTSEMFGKVHDIPQHEETPFHPRSPYGVSKLAAHWIVQNYRESYDLFACSGILFNHESPRRGEYFVTQKIVTQLGEVLRGQREFMEIGNLEARRDWGHAKDCVKAMWMMLQHEKPDDYVVATGVECSVRQFIEKVLNFHDLKIKWEGKGINEVGKLGNNVIVKTSEKYYRPCEVDRLLGDSRKIRKVLDWHPTYTIDDLISEMIQNKIPKLETGTMNACV